MRRFLLGLLCVIWCVPCCPHGADGGRPALRMLCIGNSFSLDGTALLPALLTDMGVRQEDYGIDCAVVAGASLEYWWKQYAADQPVGELYHIGGALRPAERTWTLRELLGEPWDVVVVQQASRLSDRYGTIDPFLKRLVEAIRTSAPAGRAVCIAWQMTWSGTSPQHTGPIGRKGWQRIARTAATIEQEHDIDVLIPTGTALQNARNMLPADPLSLTRDGLHLSFGVGRYVAALTWYEALLAPRFGHSALEQIPSPTVRGVDAAKEGFLPVTDDNHLDCRRAVEWALRNPFSTADTFTAPPLPSFRLTGMGSADVEGIRPAHLDIYAEGTIVGHRPEYSDTCRVRFSAEDAMQADAPKKSNLTLYLPDSCGETVWRLDAMAGDPSRLRGMLCQMLWRDMGWEQMAGTSLPWPQYVEVYLDGTYHGIYSLSADSSASVASFGASVRDFMALTKQAEENIDYVAAHIYDHIDRANWVDYCLLRQVAGAVGSQPFDGATFCCSQTDSDARLWIRPDAMSGGWGRMADGRPATEVSAAGFVLPWEADALPALLFDTPGDGGWSHDAGRRWDVLRGGALSGANVFARIDSLAARLQDTGAWDREWRRWNAGDDRLPENPDGEWQAMKRWYREQHLRLSRLYKDSLTPIPARPSDELPIYLLNGTRSRSIPQGIYIRAGLKCLHLSP